MFGLQGPKDHGVVAGGGVFEGRCIQPTQGCGVKAFPLLHHIGGKQHRIQWEQKPCSHNPRTCGIAIPCKACHNFAQTVKSLGARTTIHLPQNPMNKAPRKTQLHKIKTHWNPTWLATPNQNAFIGGGIMCRY